MVGKSYMLWTIKELVELLRKRQLNQFDVNIGVSGKRGDGKSTFINKLLLRFDGFKPWTHQVYEQEDVKRLLKSQKFSYCWDDEAINSGYKRDFQNIGQKELIKIVSAYRSNFNIYISAIPFFYSLDKALRELVFLHVHIIERGLAVLFLPLEDQIHQQDPWDTRNNQRLEEKWQLARRKNPSFRFPYHRLSTFAGYIYFGDLTPKQRRKYESIRERKRKDAFVTEAEQKENEEASWISNVYRLLLERKLTKEGLMQACLAANKKYSSVTSRLNNLLTDDGIRETVKEFLGLENDNIHSSHHDEIKQIVPQFN